MIGQRFILFVAGAQASSGADPHPGDNLLLSGDMQGGTDILLLSGDMQGGTDALLLSGTP